MPWNSSKSDIDQNHPVFLALRDWLVQVVKYYTSLSRRWQGEWEDKVFKYQSGDIVEVDVGRFPHAKTSHLLPLPKSKPRYPERIKQANQKVGKNKPWTKGLYESIIAVDLIFNQTLEQRNRICLILLDSALEIAFKEYLVHESGQNYTDKRLLEIFGTRHQVETEIKKYAKIDKEIWQKIRYYYQLRCNLVHERTTSAVSDEQVEDYREVVEEIMKDLFGLSF